MTSNSHVNHAAVPWGRCMRHKLPFAGSSNQATECLPVLMHAYQLVQCRIWTWVRALATFC